MKNQTHTPGFNWPKVRIWTTPETRLSNDSVQAVDELTTFGYDTFGLADLADIAEQRNLLELALTLREYAQRGTR